LSTQNQFLLVLKSTFQGLLEKFFLFLATYTSCCIFLWRIDSIIMLLSRVQSLLICRQKIVLYNQIWVPAICLIFTENKFLFLSYFHILVLIVLMEMKKEIQQLYQKRWKKIQRSKERHQALIALIALIISFGLPGMMYLVFQQIILEGYPSVIYCL